MLVTTIITYLSKLQVFSLTTMNPKLVRVKWQLLYKASIHGFSGSVFHYNNSDFVFGGYTKQPFSQSEPYVNDDQLLKNPVTGPGNAVRMISNSSVVYSNPGNYYNFPSAEMCGNDLNLIECEVTLSLVKELRSNFKMSTFEMVFKISVSLTSKVRDYYCKMVIRLPLLSRSNAALLRY
uniref:TLDc domain-containing protein n=1 Tax=Pundamilia nyererei TaxID=303518 RepID=A0A3B4GFT0_9CICH